MLTTLRTSLERALGVRVFKASSLMRGVDLAVDLRRALPHVPITTIVDVGAHRGQSAQSFARQFPQAMIHCVEPLASNVAHLHQAISRLPKARVYQTALGASYGTVFMDEASDLSKVSSSGTAVPMQTLDGFCTAHQIGPVSYLKIDTEGSDLDVLKGGTQRLTAHAIDLVQVEAGMNATNTTHVPLASFQAYLEPLGYYLLALYDQIREWPTQQPHLRRVNAVFVSARRIAR